MVKRRKGYFKIRASGFAKREDNPNRNDGSVVKRKRPKQTWRCPTMYRPTKRYTDEELKKLVRPTKWNPFSIPGADGKDGNARILRAKKSPTKAPQPKKPTNHTFNIDIGNLILEKSRMVKFFNEIMKAHRDKDDCDNMDIDLIDFKPWGAFVSAIGVCSNCTYKSPRTRLYEEVDADGKPGRRAAKGNMALQLTAQDSPTHNTELQLAIASLGVRPGSLNGMQKLGYKAAEITKQVGEADLIQKQQYIIKLLEERGVEKPTEVAGLLASGFDVMYSGVFKKSHVTPGTGAQQAVGTCVEQLSGDGLILGLDFVNKQCLAASRMRGKGKGPVICGPDANHPNCTATQGRDEAISERDMAARVAEKMFDTSGLISTHVVTDSDADGVKGFMDAREKIDSKIEMQRQSKNSKQKNKSTRGREKHTGDKPVLAPETHWHKDRAHLGWNMARHIQGHTFSPTFFGTKPNGRPWNAKELVECRRWLAIDIPTRVELTVSRLRDHCEKNIDEMMKLADKVADHMYTCYSGSHSSCKRSTLAQLTGCRGPSTEQCWFTTSINLTAQGIRKLNFKSDKDDAKFIRKVIAEKLSSDSIDYVALGYSTSNVESVHRAYTKGNPNNRVYYRTAEARLLSSVVRKNNGLLESTQMKYEAAGCQMQENSGQMEAFQKYQTRREQVKAAKAKPDAKKRKKELIDDRKKTHALQRMKATNMGDYQKYKLDEATKAHEEALATEGSVDETAAMVKKAKTALNLANNLAIVKKYKAQQKRKKTLEENRRKAEEARATRPQGLYEHGYATIPGTSKGR